MISLDLEIHAVFGVKKKMVQFLCKKITDVKSIITFLLNYGSRRFSLLKNLSQLYIYSAIEFVDLNYDL